MNATELVEKSDTNVMQNNYLLLLINYVKVNSGLFTQLLTIFQKERVMRSDLASC